MTRLGRRRGPLLLLCIAGVLTACGTSGLGFKDSTQLRDLRPTGFASVETPLRMSWSADPLPAGHKYLVLVDQEPMAPGESIDDLVDDACKATRGCPDKNYLDAHYMHETTKNHVTIPGLPSAGSYDADDLSQLHRVAIVVLDRANRRVGEQIWTSDLRAAQ